PVNNTESTAPAEEEEDDDDFLKEEGIHEHQKIKRLLEPGDAIYNWYNCLRITGLDGQKGLFIVCKSNIYIIDNFNVNDQNEIVEVNGERSTTVLYKPGTEAKNMVDHHCIKISY